MLTQTSTPVPIRLAKRALSGILIAASVYVAAAAIRSGLEFGADQTVNTALWRIASFTFTQQAQALEKPKQVAKAGPAPEASQKPVWVRPAKGLDWGVIHGNNGVDIANKCGTKVVAAAGGTITDIGTGWNGGYGNAVRIQHKYSSSYYAHLSEIHVDLGQEVDQGEVIGLMGISGKSTGCHLHFEVRGAANPFGK